MMFPPAAMGAIVAVIGLELAGVAANMAGLLPPDGQSGGLQNHHHFTGDVGRYRVWLRLVPYFSRLSRFLLGVLVGYALSFVMGVVDTTPIAEAHWRSRCQRSIHHVLNGLLSSPFCLRRW